MKELLKSVLQFDTAEELRDYLKPFRQVRLSDCVYKGPGFIDDVTSALFIGDCDIPRGAVFNSSEWNSRVCIAFLPGKDCVFTFSFEHPATQSVRLALQWSEFKELFTQCASLSIFFLAGTPPATVEEMLDLQYYIQIPDLRVMIHNALAIEQGDYSIAQ